MALRIGRRKFTAHSIAIFSFSSLFFSSRKPPGYTHVVAATWLDGRESLRGLLWTGANSQRRASTGVRSNWPGARSAHLWQCCSSKSHERSQIRVFARTARVPPCEQRLALDGSCARRTQRRRRPERVSHCTLHSACVCTVSSGSDFIRCFSLATSSMLGWQHTRHQLRRSEAMTPPSGLCT
jgi:hypothetical protein